MGSILLQILLIYSTIRYALSVTYIDLSYPINNETVFHPRHHPYERLVDSLGYYLAANVWFATYSMTTSEHTGTHLDTPYHSYESGWNLDQIPTDNLIAVPAVMIDMTAKVTTPTKTHLDYSITKIDLMEWEKTNGLIPQRAVVLLNTGWGERWPDDNFLNEDHKTGALSFPGLALCGARFLSSERNVVGVGIDTASIDAGYMKHLLAHMQLASRNVYVLENAANLHSLPPKDFQVWVMPIKLANVTTGAPVRLIAVVP